MAKAFLSHSSSDKYLVRKIANLLGNQRCVLDEKSFEPGARTLDEIFMWIGGGSEGQVFDPAFNKR